MWAALGELVEMESGGGYETTSGGVVFVVCVDDLVELFPCHSW